MILRKSSYFDQRVALKATSYIGMACATNFKLNANAEEPNPGMIGNIPRLAEGWQQGLQSRGMQTFPLAFTGNQGNISSTESPIYFDEALAEINGRVAIPAEESEAAPPIRHVHTQIYHRSRNSLRRVRAVQDMCMGYFVPRIALREYTSRKAENAIRRVEQMEALGRDGKASQRRFKEKLADTPLGMRYENVVVINMESVQEQFKTTKSVTPLPNIPARGFS